jgi:hypothetical protein
MVAPIPADRGAAVAQATPRRPGAHARLDAVRLTADHQAQEDTAMDRKLAVGLSMAVALCALSSSAFAQYAPQPAPPPPPPPGYGPGPAPGYYPPPPPGIQRHGFTIGFSLGGGSFNCDTCADKDAFEGFALDIHLGAMIGPRAAIMFDGWGVSHNLDGGSFTHVINTGALQFWVGPKVWLKGGIGIGRLSLSNDKGQTVAESENGAAVMFAGGFEVYQGQTFAMDLQLRGGAASYSDADGIVMGSINLGFNWY